MRYSNPDTRDYQFIDKMVAGLVLSGADAKSLRVSGVQFNGSKVEVINNQPSVFNLTFTPYRFATNQLVDKTGTRNLLLNQKEIKKLISYRHQKYMLIPTSIFLQGKWFKLEIGIGRKLKKYEKRQKIKDQEIKQGIY